MKKNLNTHIFAGIAAGGTTLLLLKGGDYKWLLLVGFVVTLFIFIIFLKTMKKGSG